MLSITQIYELFDSLLTSLSRGCRGCLEGTVSVLQENVLAHQTPDNIHWLLFLEKKEKIDFIMLSKS